MNDPLPNRGHAEGPARANTSLQSLLEAAPDAMLVTNQTGKIAFANGHAAKLLGFTREELMEGTVERLIPPRLRDVYRRERDNFFADPHVQPARGWRELFVLSANNTEIPVKISLSPFQSESETFAINTIRDASEREIAEAKGKPQNAMEALYRKIVETTNEGISIIDSGFRYSFVNRQMAMMLGYEPEEMLGRDVMEFQFPENLDRKKQILEHRREGVREHYEDWLRRKDGSGLWVRIAATPIFNENGDFDGALAMMSDITERKRAEEALRESEERFRRAAQAGKMFAYDWDTTTDRIVQSQEAAEILGLAGDATHTTGREILARVHPDDLKRIDGAIEGPTPEKPVYRSVIRYLRPDGRMIWVERFGRGFFDAQGKLVRRVGMVVDVTNRKHAEEALRESEERFRFAAQAGRMFAYEWDMATDQIVRSEECAEILGLTGDVAHTTGKEVAATIHPDDRERIAAAVAGLTPENHVYRTVLRVFRPDGSVVWLERTGRGFFDDEGRLVRLIGMAVDVTERKRAEEALRESEEQFRSVFRDAGVGMIIVLPDGHFLAANAAFCECVGYTEEELRSSETVQSITHPESWPDFSRKLGETLAGGAGFQRFEKRCLHKSGRVVWAECSTSLIRDPGGEPRYFVCEVLDITERKRAEETLRESEEKFRSVFRDAGVGMIIVSPDGRFLAANDAFCECLGYTEEELREKTVQSLTWPEDWPRFSRKLDEALATGVGFQRFEKRCLHKSGRVVWGESSASLIRGSGGEPRYFVGEMLDITERKRAEQAIRESEEQFRSVFRDAGVGMKILSPDGRFLAANGAFCECVGYTEEELLRKNIESLIHPEDWPAFSRVLNEALAHGPGFQRIERRYVHKSGRIIWGECSASLIRGPGGEPRYFVGELLDTTERKQAEEARSSVNRRLIEAQEEERARIARDLHDDINQRLALLAMGIGQIKKESPGFPAALIERIDELSRQTAEIAGDIQAISHRLHSSKLGYLGIVAAMEGFCEESADQQKVEIHFSHDGVPPDIPQEISLCLFRVLQEALHNAVKHSGVGRFEVQLYGTPDEIGLSVSDSGVGFDPKAAMNQRGLGLISMSERLRLVRGTISIESKPNAGTRIHALVPLSRESRSMGAAG